jgi:hypothetical protein
MKRAKQFAYKVVDLRIIHDRLISKRFLLESKEENGQAINKSE